MDLQKVQGLVRNLFETQAFGVLATQMDKKPYTTLVAFASTNDLKSLLFVTKFSTAKYMHIQNSPQVAMLIDNRLNHPQDIHNAAVATALGDAAEVSEENKEIFTNIYLLKHPHLKNFLSSPSSVLLVLVIHKIILVTKFQQVDEWKID